MHCRLLSALWPKVTDGDVACCARRLPASATGSSCSSGSRRASSTPTWCANLPLLPVILPGQIVSLHRAGAASCYVALRHSDTASRLQRQISRDVDFRASSTERV